MGGGAEVGAGVMFPREETETFTTLNFAKKDCRPFGKDRLEKR
jgi:hypothetical protein